MVWRIASDVGTILRASYGLRGKVGEPRRGQSEERPVSFSACSEDRRESFEMSERRDEARGEDRPSDSVSRLKLLVVDLVPLGFRTISPGGREFIAVR